MTNEETMAPEALSDVQHRRLSALLDTIVPTSEDGSMPSAGEMDFLSYLREQAAGFLPVLTGIVELFDDTFPNKSLPARVALVREFALAEAQAFNSLVFRVYDCYYQNDRVRGLIGAQLGPPFPGGHNIPAGDLSSLETVKARAKGYRR